MMDNPNDTQLWDHNKDEKLIGLVKLKPELYDLSSPYYSDTVTKKRSWMSIGKQMGHEDSKCKERWESLRGQYRKQMNKLKKNGHETINNPKWKYQKQMSFLRPLLKNRQRITPVQQDESEIMDHTEDNSTQSVCKEQVEQKKDEPCYVNAPISQEGRPRKKKIQERETSASATLMKYLVEKKEQQPTDPIDTFFSLMATTVKTFYPADQHYIKTKVFSLVSEVEEKYIHDQNVLAHVTSAYTCSLPSASPAQSQYSSASSAGSQEEFPHTQYQESIGDSPTQPCSSRGAN